MTFIYQRIRNFICKCRCKDNELKPPSLKNIGATCYMNSAFQGISACDTFVKEINDLCVIGEDSNLEQLQIFKKLIDILNGCSIGELEISLNPTFRHWNRFGQQDSYELLAYVLNEIYNELRKYKEKNGIIPTRDWESWLQQKLPMRLIMQYEIKCECKMITKCPMQSDLALHVTIPIEFTRSKLKDLLDQYFAEDSIIDYQCNSKDCNGKGAKRVVRLTEPLPHTICIHLQRTFWNGLKMKKINNAVEFSTVLEVKSNFCLNLSEKRLYDLVSVIEHFGTVKSGHYVCYKKLGQQWFITNDSSVRHVSDDHVLKCQAYILFYEMPYNSKEVYEI